MKNKILCPVCKDSILSRLYKREVDDKGSQTFKGRYWLCDRCKKVYCDDLSLLSSAPKHSVKENIVDYHASEISRIVDYSNASTKSKEDIVDYGEIEGQKVIGKVTKNKTDHYLILESGKLVPIPLNITTTRQL